MLVDKNTPRFRVLTSLAEFEAYEDEYRHLFDGSNASPFSSYEWIRASILNQNPQGKIFICIAEDSEGPYAAVPLIAIKELFTVRLELLGEGPATHNAGLVLERGADLDILQQACFWLYSTQIRWDYCIVERIPEGSYFSTRKVPSENGGFCFHFDAEPSSAIKLPECWEDYLAGVSKKHRSNIRRTTRNFESDFDVKMLRAGLRPDDDSRLIEKLIEDSLSVCRRSWQGNSAPGAAICDADTIDFFRQSSLTLAQSAMLDLAVLYSNDSPVAYSWGVTRGGTSWISTSGFDAELRDLGPGTILDSLVIKDSIDRGMLLLDWGDEFAEYKRRWCNHSIPLYNSVLYAKQGISKFKHRIQDRWDRSIKSRIDSMRSRLD